MAAEPRMTRPINNSLSAGSPPEAVHGLRVGVATVAVR
jgi:hypothetical protein